MIIRIIGILVAVAMMFGVVIAPSVSALTQTTSRTPVLSRITLFPTSGKIVLGSPLQLKVVAVYKNSTSQYVTTSTGTMYTSSNPSIASVDAKGLVTAHEGAALNKQVSITATYGGMTAKATLTVISAITLTVSPETIDLEPGDSEQLKVLYPLNDGTQADVTKAPGTTYVSSNPKIATVSITGLVTIPANVVLADENNHLANITVTNNGISRTVMVRALMKDTTYIDQLILTPQTTTMQPGESQQLKLEYSYMDGATKKDVTMSTGTTYTSSNPALATVSPSGLVTVSKNITENTAVTITATNNLYTATLSATLVLKIQAIKLQRISVSPKSIILYPGDSKQVKVYEEYNDGRKVDVTNTATFSLPTGINLPITITGGLITLSSTYTGATTKVKVNISEGGQTTFANIHVRRASKK